HAVDPHTSLTRQKGFKVDDFYAARSRTIPPLPWSNIAPPFSHALRTVNRGIAAQESLIARPPATYRVKPISSTSISGRSARRRVKKDIR
ncbi:hypothetical protein OSJ57_24880, partial [Sphingomonas sp. HH69]